MGPNVERPHDTQDAHESHEDEARGTLGHGEVDVAAQPRQSRAVRATRWHGVVSSARAHRRVQCGTIGVMAATHTGIVVILSTSACIVNMKEHLWMVRAADGSCGRCERGSGQASDRVSTERTQPNKCA